MTELRANDNLTEWGGGAQPTRHSPTKSTVYKYKLDLASVNSAMSVPFSVVTTTRPNRRRRGSASGGARGEVNHKSDDESEGADWDITERAQVSSAAPASPSRVGWATVGARTNYYNRPDPDIPSADFRDL